MPDREQRAEERITAQYPVPILRRPTGNGTVEGRRRKRSSDRPDPRETGG